MKKKKNEELREEKALLTFLKHTKEGKYAPVDVISISTPRTSEQRLAIGCDEIYLYSMR